MLLDFCGFGIIQISVVGYCLWWTGSLLVWCCLVGLGVVLPMGWLCLSVASVSWVGFLGG